MKIKDREMLRIYGEKVRHTGNFDFLLNTFLYFPNHLHGT